jgi:hypothetical protein
MKKTDSLYCRSFSGGLFSSEDAYRDDVLLIDIKKKNGIICVFNSQVDTLNDYTQ